MSLRKKTGARPAPGYGRRGAHRPAQTVPSLFLGNIDEDEQAARIYDVMLKSPASEDIDNWVVYFHNEVEHPFMRVAVESIVCVQTH